MVNQYMLFSTKAEFLLLCHFEVQTAFLTLQ